MIKTETLGNRKAIHREVCTCGNPTNRGGYVCDNCADDCVAWFMLYDGDNQEYFEYVFRQPIDSTGQCAICEKNYILGGYNPHPVVDEKKARCCTHCNNTIVIPERMKRICQIAKVK